MILELRSEDFQQDVTRVDLHVLETGRIYYRAEVCPPLAEEQLRWLARQMEACVRRDRVTPAEAATSVLSRLNAKWRRKVRHARRYSVKLVDMSAVEEYVDREEAFGDRANGKAA